MFLPDLSCTGGPPWPPFLEKLDQGKEGWLRRTARTRSLADSLLHATGSAVQGRSAGASSLSFVSRMFLTSPSRIRPRATYRLSQLNPPRRASILERLR